MEYKFYKLTEDQRLKINKTIEQYFDSRGLNSSEIRRIIGDTSKNNDGRFLNLVIKDA